MKIVIETQNNIKLSNIVMMPGYSLKQYSLHNNTIILLVDGRSIDVELVPGAVAKSPFANILFTEPFGTFIFPVHEIKASKDPDDVITKCEIFG